MVEGGLLFGAFALFAVLCSSRDSVGRAWGKESNFGKMVKIYPSQDALTTLSKSASSIVEELLDAIETAESRLPPLPFTLSSSWLFCELNLNVTVLKIT